MAEYDSILKEKKTYKEPIKEPKSKKKKKFPWLLLDIIGLLLILIISYIIYYTKILAPEQIFINDLKELTHKYENVLKPLELDVLTNDKYNLTGTISLNDKTYNFDINKNEDITKLQLKRDEQILDYYLTSNQNYLKLSSYKDEYYQVNKKNNYLSLISNLKKCLTNIPRDMFMKKFYLNGTNPIVESNLVLNNEYLSTNLELNNDNDAYEVLFTFKNHAITNEIIDIKITINNLTTNERRVVLYENDILTFKDDNQTITFLLEEKDKDFTLKIYKNDIIYSVLTGVKQQNIYQYTYQIIDKIYNINLKISNTNNVKNYEMFSVIEQDNVRTESSLNISFNYSKDNNENISEITDSINYNSLSKEEQDKYQSQLNELLNDLRQFIDKHKNSVN